MNSARSEPDAFPDEDVVFRTLAAPGLEEDDLFAAMDAGRPDTLWGAGLPVPFASAPEEDESPDVARRRRHDELLKRWHPRDDAWSPRPR